MVRERYLKLVSLLLVPVLVSGCSTMFGRQHDEQNVNFDSKVQGVEVICSGKRVSAPGSLPLMQSRNHSCTAEAPGYERKVFTIKSGISGSGFGHSTATNTALWGWWTLGIGTVVGWLIDSVSGAMRNLKEDSIYLDMQPIGTTSTPEKILQKTVQVGQTVVNTPINAVKNTASATLDTTLSGSAQSMGIVEEKETKPTEATNDTPQNLRVV